MNQSPKQSDKTSSPPTRSPAHELRPRATLPTSRLVREEEGLQASDDVQATEVMTDGAQTPTTQAAQDASAADVGSATDNAAERTADDDNEALGLVAGGASLPSGMGVLAYAGLAGLVGVAIGSGSSSSSGSSSPAAGAAAGAGAGGGAGAGQETAPPATPAEEPTAPVVDPSSGVDGSGAAADDSGAAADDGGAAAEDGSAAAEDGGAAAADNSGAAAEDSGAAAGDSGDGTDVSGADAGNGGHDTGADPSGDATDPPAAPTDEPAPSPVDGGGTAVDPEPDPIDPVAPVTPEVPGGEEPPVVLSPPLVQVIRGSGTGTAEDPMLINALGALGVTTDAGADWHYSTDGGVTWQPGSSSELTAAELAEGNNSLQVVQVDAAGHTSPATVVEVVRDTVAPDAPEAAVVAGSGVGTEADPMLINGNSAITVTTEADAQWHYSVDGGQSWREGTADGISAADLAEGGGTVQIQQTDRAGNVSERTMISVVKDSTVQPLTVTLGNVVGYDETGLPILDWNLGGELHFANLEAGARIEYFFPENDRWLDLGSADTVDVPSLLWGSGYMNPLFRQVDAFGNISEVTAFEYMFDRPGIGVNIVTPAVQFSAISNAFGETLGTGSAAQPYLVNQDGSLQVGNGTEASWRYSLDGGVTWEAGTNGGISPERLKESLNSLQVITVDRAGNTSWTATFEVEKDTIAPDAPAVDMTPFNGGPVLLGASGSLSMTFESGSTWKYSLDGGKTWADGSGTSLSSWYLQEGHNELQIMQFDRVRNASEVTSLSVEKDGYADSLGLTLNGIAGLNRYDEAVYQSSNGTINLSYVEAGATVQMRVGTSSTWTDLGTINSLRVGDLGLSSGRETLSFRQLDAAGNVGTQTEVAFWYDMSSSIGIITPGTSFSVGV